MASQWPVKPHDTFRGDYQNPGDGPPILVIGGTHDPATPYQWAERVTLDLGNARLMTYDGDGHGAINDGDLCVLIPILTYLADPTALPPEGLVCEQSFEPFTF